MLNCLIVDHQKPATPALKKFINLTLGLNYSGFYKDTLSIEIDKPENTIVFLNLHNPKTQRTDISKLLANGFKVIVISETPEFAAEGFELGVDDFFVRSFNYDRFLRAINKIKRSATPANESNQVADYIYVQSETKGKIIRINLNQLILAEGAQNYILIHTGPAKHKTYLTMNEIQSSLAPDYFARIHKSFIVNINKIQAVEKNVVYLENNLKANIGDSFKEEFLSRIRCNLVKSNR